MEFAVALLCYAVFFADGSWETECATWQLGWVGRVVLFNLGCEVTFCGFWHWFVYVSDFRKGLQPHKFNPVNQYEKKPTDRVGMFSSTSGHLQREILFTTLGWLQSSAWQCAFMWGWASGRVPYYGRFWEHPGYSLAYLAAITYWREVHFYFVHRGMHPWWDRKNGLADGDVGAFLYRHVHSLHHKSYNPGPWSGLSMHPVEHLMYYSCTITPCLLQAHPIHFLYCKFHADIAPIGGHDGYDSPSANGDFHWLHHAKFECNYGVPWPVNMDKLCGTWLEYKDWKVDPNKSMHGIMQLT
jgi:sterol desaturase/sphingolipid hydroxylase (fatty acid hydroxylase superfamily)